MNALDLESRDDSQQPEIHPDRYETIALATIRVQQYPCFQPLNYGQRLDFGQWMEGEPTLEH